jgi:hypothetical protein
MIESWQRGYRYLLLLKGPSTFAEKWIVYLIGSKERR